MELVSPQLPFSTCFFLSFFLLTTKIHRGNYAGFFWGGSCFLSIVYTYFRLPEPRGRSFAELDLLFEKKISARKFATTPVDVFADTHVEGTAVFDKYEEKVDAAVRTESIAAA